MFKENEVLSRVVLLIFLLSLACKDVQRTQEKDVFIISLNIKILEDDRLKVYYLKNRQEPYSEKNKTEVNVKGLDNFQEINFSLPQLPHKFRIDLGEKGIESMIWISRITLKYKGQNITIKDNVLHRFFKSNIYAIKSENGYERRKLSSRYDPFIESTALLHKKIELEF